MPINPASSALDPSGPAQPTLDQSYATQGNAVDKNAAEQRSTALNSKLAKGTNPVDQRGPSHGSDRTGVPSSLGWGVRGAPAGEEAKGLTEEQVGQHQELDGQQMRAPGEGDVRDAVVAKLGAGPGEPSLTSDLDRKKQEQAPMRQAIQAERQHNVDVGGVLSDRGGPANPVDKKGYPNSGSQ